MSRGQGGPAWLEQRTQDGSFRVEVLRRQTRSVDGEVVGSHRPPLIVLEMSWEEQPAGCVGRQDCRAGRSAWKVLRLAKASVDGPALGL